MIMKLVKMQRRIRSQVDNLPQESIKIHNTYMFTEVIEGGTT